MKWRLSILFQMERILIHQSRRWNVWIEKLRHNYFYSPWVARTNRFTTRTVIFSSLSQILKFVSVFPMQSHFALYKGFHWKPLNLLVIVVLFGDSFGYVYLKICVHVCLSDDVQLKLSVMGFILMLLILLILILSFVFKFSV